MLTDGRTDRRTDGQTDWGIAIALSQIGRLGAKKRNGGYIRYTWKGHNISSCHDVVTMSMLCICLCNMHMSTSKARKQHQLFYIAVQIKLVKYENTTTSKVVNVGCCIICSYYMYATGQTRGIEIKGTWPDNKRHLETNETIENKFTILHIQSLQLTCIKQIMNLNQHLVVCLT